MWGDSTQFEVVGFFERLGPRGCHPPPPNKPGAGGKVAPSLGAPENPPPSQLREDSQPLSKIILLTALTKNGGEGLLRLVAQLCVVTRFRDPKGSTAGPGFCKTSHTHDNLKTPLTCFRH